MMFSGLVCLSVLAVASAGGVNSTTPDPNDFPDMFEGMLEGLGFSSDVTECSVKDAGFDMEAWEDAFKKTTSTSPFTAAKGWLELAKLSTKLPSLMKKCKVMGKNAGRYELFLGSMTNPFVFGGVLTKVMLKYSKVVEKLQLEVAADFTRQCHFDYGRDIGEEQKIMMDTEFFVADAGTLPARDPYRDFTNGLVRGLGFKGDFVDCARDDATFDMKAWEEALGKVSSLNPAVAVKGWAEIAKLSTEIPSVMRKCHVLDKEMAKYTLFLASMANPFIFGPVMTEVYVKHKEEITADIKQAGSDFVRGCMFGYGRSLGAMQKIVMDTEWPLSSSSEAPLFGDGEDVVVV